MLRQQNKHGAQGKHLKNVDGIYISQVGRGDWKIKIYISFCCSAIQLQSWIASHNSSTLSGPLCRGNIAQSIPLLHNNNIKTTYQRFPVTPRHARRTKARATQRSMCNMSKLEHGITAHINTDAAIPELRLLQQLKIKWFDYQIITTLQQYLDPSTSWCGIVPASKPL